MLDKSNQFDTPKTVMTNKKQGRIYLVPTPLLEGHVESIPTFNREVVRACRHFLVESFKMGRRHIRAMVPDFDLDQSYLEELNKHTPLEELETLIAPVELGQDICILSDAGCPGVADPGSALVQLAHRKRIEVVPLSGPSSILLALMASGFNGQQFIFLGYLSRDKGKLKQDLKRIEQEARKGITQIFMETPYRNLAVMQELLQVISGDLQLCIACDITGSKEFILSQPVAEWKKQDLPDLHKRPCIFVIGK
jgi:16S rRNA (cytidine1402-2'-O)-methyltransferase